MALGAGVRRKGSWEYGESRGSDPRCVGRVVICVWGSRDFGTVIGGCSSALFCVVGSVETVTHPGVCVGWVTVVYSVVGLQ